LINIFNLINILISCFNVTWSKTSLTSRSRHISVFSRLFVIYTSCTRFSKSTTRFICMRCWLWIFCKLCLLEELNNLINIDRAVTAFYSHVELTHSQKAKQWQCNHQHVEACTYTEWQQRLCAHAATNIQHSHSHCEDMTQLLRTYTSVWRSKSINFDFQVDLHAA